MDSMRHLSTSLPRQRGEYDLAADFRNAARSVTDLYRNAVASQNTARAGGYQDALDDLLAFLDKENLGLMDGEGWRVRQWATERLDTDPTRQAGAAHAEDDDDTNITTVKDDDKATERSSSPEVQRKPHLPLSSSDLAEEISTPRRVVSEPPQAPLHQRSLPQSDFTFESNHAYPVSTHDRDTNADMEMDASNPAPPIQAFTASSNPSSAEAVRIVQRPTRSTRHSNHNRRNNGSNTPTLSFNLGAASGSKRKIPYPDFFDISGINDGSDRKDGSGTGRGGKRRHV
ncbi:uncharacterized protein MYCFIDRAFT_211140 [Pseudocercospora fijiensis CIRAD86]|uniref:Uncharacterized protein n=1 Tax=Pseudocercospora fijiensis (strain CIRAD86) TaxID=383855 RepID=M3B015_PSEFD|nr:uncharacterized protein MYCFIDRAFT_211140 [Pseudocercospora fijiensis CIRAD86]EME82743.1 hypothetical protein MYCFIDRAFT_211140 [Pseudocercospora fijiensis CIRAD86]